MPIDMDEINARVEAIRERREQRKPMIEAIRKEIEEERRQEETRKTIEAYQKRRADRLAARGLMIDPVSGKVVPITEADKNVDGERSK